MTRTHLVKTPTLALVVDDISGNRELFVEILEALAVDTLEAEDGGVALQKIAQAPPQVIFLDYEMPYLNGFEFLKALARTPYSHIPVIMISTHIKRNIEAVEKLGAIAWVHKPPIFKEVETLLAELGILSLDPL